jgi:protein O-mannosyl-transferase
MSPIHEFDTSQFQALSLSSFLVDAAALGIVLSSIYFALRRSSPIACMALMLTAGLITVLHIAPVTFAPSLYHERYFMTSLAAVCAMFPLVRFHAPVGQQRMPLIRMGIGTIACLWLITATLDVRSTIPLWSNNVNLWRWAVASQPGSINAVDSLLDAYIEMEDYANANRLADQLIAQHTDCADCMLNAAILAVDENDPKKAASALALVRSSKLLVSDKQMFQTYLTTTGQMLAEQGQLADATAVLGAAAKTDRFNPYPQLSLAIVLAMQNKKSEALQLGEAAIAMMPPDKRSSSNALLDRAINSKALSTQKTSPASNAK